MTIRFFLVDSVEVSRRKTERLIWEYIEQVDACDNVLYEHVDSEFGKFADELVVEPGIRNVYLLSVKLDDDVDGLHIAKKIRDKDKEGYIIFLTKHLEYAIMSYNLNLRALNYIYSHDPNLRKNLFGSFDVIREEVKDARYQVEDEGKVLIIKSQQGVQKIHMNRILFIESRQEKRGIRIHTHNGIYDSSESLKTVVEKLDESFLQSHRSYIVNVKKMTGMSSQGQSYIGTFGDGKECSISKKYYPMVLEAFGKDDQ